MRSYLSKELQCPKIFTYFLAYKEGGVSIIKSKFYRIGAALVTAREKECSKVNNIYSKSQKLIKRVQEELEAEGYKVIPNFSMKSNGKKQVINLVAINRKGVYLIKTKNLNAVLTGDYKDKVWKCLYEDGEIFELYNTMKTLYVSGLGINKLLSEYQIRALTTTIFGDETVIKLKNAHPFSILNVKNMWRFFNSNKFKERLTDDTVEEIYEKLKSLSQAV